jgi:hypothetical protein
VEVDIVFFLIYFSCSFYYKKIKKKEEVYDIITFFLLQIAPDWRQVLSLKAAIDDRITKGSHYQLLMFPCALSSLLIIMLRPMGRDLICALNNSDIVSFLHCRQSHRLASYWCICCCTDYRLGCGSLCLVKYMIVDDM